MRKWIAAGLLVLATAFGSPTHAASDQCLGQWSQFEQGLKAEGAKYAKLTDYQSEGLIKAYAAQTGDTTKITAVYAVDLGPEDGFGIVVVEHGDCVVALGRMSLQAFQDKVMGVNDPSPAGR